MHLPFSVTELQKSFTGKLISPDDPTYDEFRVVVPGGIDRKPALIVCVENENDVRAAIALAQSHHLSLSVRSGGHSALAHGICDDGVVIDVRQMKAIAIDTENKTVWAEAGLTAAELTKELDKHNFVLGFGDTGSVGISGITLAGGVGYLVRKFGLTIDNLLAVKIVLADGQSLTVDEHTSPDLFWAIRGGGGNFGVVTSLKFKLHVMTGAYGGMLFLPANPVVLAKFMQLTQSAPDELSTIVNVMPSPPMPMIPQEFYGKLVIFALIMYVGGQQEAEKVMAPFRSLATPLADMLKPMRYKDIFMPEDPSYHPTASAYTMFMNHIDESTAETILEKLSASDASMRVVQLRSLGGAMSRIASDATAFAHRTSSIMVNVAAFYQGIDDKKSKDAWVLETASVLNQGDDGAYVAFLGEDGASRIRNAYPGETYKRLAFIKKIYDPQNFFAFNHNISPFGA